MPDHVLPHLELYVVLQIEPRASCAQANTTSRATSLALGNVSGIPFLPLVLLINRVSPNSPLTKFCQLGARGSPLLTLSLAVVPGPCGSKGSQCVNPDPTALALGLAYYYRACRGWLYGGDNGCLQGTRNWDSIVFLHKGTAGQWSHNL